jgi:hypothetical protein
MKMSWNYRIMKSVVMGEELYGIHEVYYDEGGNPNGWTEEPIYLLESSIADLRNVLSRINEAFDKEIIDIGQFDKKGDKID